MQEVTSCHQIPVIRSNGAKFFNSLRFIIFQIYSQKHNCLCLHALYFQRQCQIGHRNIVTCVLKENSYAGLKRGLKLLNVLIKDFLALNERSNDF